MNAHFVPTGIGLQVAPELVPTFRDTLSKWKNVKGVQVVGQTCHQVSLMVWPKNGDSGELQQLGQDLVKLDNHSRLSINVVNNGQPIPLSRLVL